MIHCLILFLLTHKNNEKNRNDFGSFFIYDKCYSKISPETTELCLAEHRKGYIYIYSQNDTFTKLYIRINCYSNIYLHNIIMVTL